MERTYYKRKRNKFQGQIIVVSILRKTVLILRRRVVIYYTLALFFYVKTFHMDHTHHHHDLSRKHLQEHPICIATIIYNIIVLVVELVIIALVNHMSREDLVGYEGVLQGIHLLGIILLAVVNRRWIHRWSKHNDNTAQSVGKFFSISTLILIAHIVLLHIVPRIIGFEMHQHEEGGGETVEFIALGAIILFVTIAFWWRDAVLHRFGLKNKFTVSLKKR